MTRGRGPLLNVLSTFNLCLVSGGYNFLVSYLCGSLQRLLTKKTLEICWFFAVSVSMPKICCKIRTQKIIAKNKKTPQGLIFRRILKKLSIEIYFEAFFNLKRTISDIFLGIVQSFVNSHVSKYMRCSGYIRTQPFHESKIYGDSKLFADHQSLRWWELLALF